MQLPAQQDGRTSIKLQSVLYREVLKIHEHSEDEGQRIRGKSGCISVEMFYQRNRPVWES
jgi:hypothetical protein